MVTLFERTRSSKTFHLNDVGLPEGSRRRPEARIAKPSLEARPIRYRLLAIFALITLVAGPSVAEHPWCMPTESFSLEFLLQEVSTDEALRVLKGRYPWVRFKPYSTMAGFYATGSREDLLSMKREMDSIDWRPKPPAEPVCEYFSVPKYEGYWDARDPVETIAFLSQRFPEATYRYDDRCDLLMVVATPDLMDDIRDWVKPVDKKMDQVMHILNVMVVSENGLGMLRPTLTPLSCRVIQRDTLTGSR